MTTWHKSSQSKVLGRWAWGGQCYKRLVKRIGQVWPPGPNQARAAQQQHSNSSTAAAQQNSSSSTAAAQQQQHSSSNIAAAAQQQHSNTAAAAQQQQHSSSSNIAAAAQQQHSNTAAAAQQQHSNNSTAATAQQQQHSNSNSTTAAAAQQQHSSSSTAAQQHSNTATQGWCGHQACKFKLPPASPQAQNYKPRPSVDKTFPTKNAKKVHFYIVKSGQKSSKNAKIDQKHKNYKSKIKVSKSLANPITNQRVKQN